MASVRPHALLFRSWPYVAICNFAGKGRVAIRVASLLAASTGSLDTLRIVERARFSGRLTWPYVVT